MNDERAVEQTTERRHGERRQPTEPVTMFDPSFEGEVVLGPAQEYAFTGNIVMSVIAGSATVIFRRRKPGAA